MGVLNDHSERPAQISFAYIADIDTVIEDPPALDLIEAVDQINDRRFPRAGRSDKRDLLPRLCIQTDPGQDSFLRDVPEYYILKPNISPELSKLPACILPRINPCIARALHGRSVPTYLCRHKRHGSLIDLRFFVHHLKNPLSSCKGRTG